MLISAIVFISIDFIYLNVIKEYFNKFCQEYGLKIKDFGPILRIALTGSSSSAGGVFEVCEIIGKSEVQKRINNLL